MRARLALAADAVALVLCSVCLWQLFVIPERPFGVFAAVAAVVALVAAMLARAPIGTIVDVPVALFAGVTVLSAVVNRGDFSAPSWQPAADVLVRVLWFYGLCALLTTERRVGALIAFVVGAVSVTAVQSLADHAGYGWGTRIAQYPSVISWIGYPQIGLVVAIAFSLTVPLLAISRSPIAIASAAVLAGVFVTALAFLYSRSASVAAAVVYAMLLVVEWWRLKTRRLAIAAASALAVVAAALIVSGAGVRPLKELWGGGMYLSDTSTSASGRIAIWSRAAGVIREHPWLGVGPGNYPSAVQRIPMPPGSHPDAVAQGGKHAHSMMLHVAAESGVPGAALFLLIWLRMLRRLSSLWSASATGLLALALSGALVAFFVRSLTDYFMTDGMAHSERSGLLLWTLFAGAAAVARLPLAQGRGTSAIASTDGVRAFV